MTWVIVPTLLVVFGNGRLARAVVGDGEPVDHVAGVAGRIVHRGHPRALLARIILEERRIELYCEIARQQSGKDLRLLRLELVDALDGGIRPLHGLRHRKRHELLLGHDLRHRRLEPVVDDGRHIELAGIEEGQHARSDPLGIGEL